MWGRVGCCFVLIVLGPSADAHADDDLVPNGSFEQVSPDAVRFTAEWQIEKGPRECFRLTSDRPFRPALSQQEALEKLRDRAELGYHNPALIDRFEECLNARNAKLRAQPPSTAEEKESQPQ